MSASPDTLWQRADDVLSRQELADLGVTKTGLKRLLESRMLSRVRPGWYWVRPNDRKLRPAEEYLPRIRATVLAGIGRDREIVLAGPAAALWWDLPWVGPVPPWVTVAGATTSGRAFGAALHRIGQVPASQIVEHNGAWVTTVARTVADVARLSHGKTALVVADAALHENRINVSELAEISAGLSCRRGIGKARSVLAMADGRAESPGESVSRYLISTCGLPVPDLQAEFRLPHGGLARTDFCWRGERVIGEFDGMTKYGTGDVRSTVIAEKQREEALRALGYQVFRWTWSDIWPDPSIWLSDLGAMLRRPRTYG